MKYEYNPLSGEMEVKSPVQQTVINGDVTNNPDNEDLQSENGVIKLADRDTIYGKGYKILRRGVDLQSQFNQENTIYEIRYDFDLGGNTLNIPAGCTLKFEGGSLANGVLKGNNTNIVAAHKIFNNVNVEGEWVCDGEACWWASCSEIAVEGENMQIVNKIDCTSDIQLALNSSFSRLNICGFYYITSTLQLLRPKEIVMSGNTADTYLFQKKATNANKTFIFTDRNITMLRIAPEVTVDYPSRTSIIGGNFDASLAGIGIYDSDMIVVDISEDRKIWGLNISCGLFGSYYWRKSPKGRGISFFTGDGSGYASMIRINSIIEWFDKGIEIISSGSTWITDIIIDGQINHCATAVRSNTDVYMNASIQPDSSFFTTKDNGVPLIDCVSGYWVIGGMIWDVGLSSSIDGDIRYSNSIAINNVNSDIKLTGKTALIYGNGSKISGDKRFLEKEDFTMSNRRNFYPRIEGNILEAFNHVGEVTINLKTSNGDLVDGLSVANLENMFSSNKAGTTISLNDYSQEGNYVEIKLSKFNIGLSPTIGYVGFLAYNKSAYTDFGFKRYEIEINYSNYEGRSKVFSSVPTTTQGGYVQFEMYSSLGYSARDIVIRLYDIYATIDILKVIAIPITNPYTGLRSPYLPISGGEVYGEVDFKQFKINGTPLELTGNKIILQKGSIDISSRTMGFNAFGSILQLSDNANPVTAGNVFILQSVSGISPTKYAVYRISSGGYTGSSILEITKLFGNFDYKFKVYKKTDINANYILFVDTTSSGFYNTECVLLGNCSNGVDYINVKESDVISDGYTEYSFANIGQSGESRPASTRIGNGFQFFDTTLNKPIWWTGSSWVDATGTEV